MSDEEKRLTHVQSRLIRAAESLEIEEAREIVFQHGIMCQVSLPRSRQESRVFERTFKNASIRIEAGSIWDGYQWVEQPLPYGAKPRLALLYINSQAVKTKNPQIDIGQSYRDFCTKLGLSTGGKSFYDLKKQMTALAASRMILGFTHQDGIASTVDVKPIKRFDAWMAKNNKQPALWPAVLTLHVDYMESLLEHAVPLPFEAIAALSHSAIALDLLAFFSRRLHTLEKPIKVPFVLLKEQFGQEYKGKNPLKDFKKEFLQALRQVKAVYSDAQLEQVTGGILFKPSRPLVEGARIAASLPPKQRPKPPKIRLKAGELTEKTREAFRVLCPRLDVYACKADFDVWLLTKDEPKDYQKAFLGFASKWKVGKG
jgi:hypothetical protein